MWSHYAQNHTGICLGVKTHKLKEWTGINLNFYIDDNSNSKGYKNEEIFIKLRKVIYGKNNIMLPAINEF